MDIRLGPLGLVAGEGLSGYMELCSRLFLGQALLQPQLLQLPPS